MRTMHQPLCTLVHTSLLGTWKSTSIPVKSTFSNAHNAPALVHLCAQRLEKYLHTQEELYLPQKNFYSCTQYQLVYRYIYLYTSCCLLAQYKVRCTLKKYSCLKSLVWTTHRLWRSNVKWICKEKVGTDGFRSMHCI